MIRLADLWPFKRKAPPAPAAPPPPPIFTMGVGDGIWGHHVKWRDFDKREIYGHWDNFPATYFARGGEHVMLPHTLVVGATIRCHMQSGRMALFRITKLKWESNPPDMFFGTVEDIGWEE